MRIEFSGAAWYWRGPAPWFFVSVPEPESQQLQAIAGSVTYGWGMIPATVRLGGSTWYTALFPKDGRFLVPIKASVRRAEGVAEGDEVTVHLVVG